MKNQPSPLEVAPFWEDQATAGKPIDLLSLVGVFLGRWPFLVAMAALGFLLALGISLVLTPRFTSQAVFLPPSQHISGSDNPLALLWKTPSSAIYTGLLLSDSVLGDVVEHTNLQTIFKAKDLEQARLALKQTTQVSTDTAGFVTLQVTNKDPRLARDIATNFMSALARLNDRLAISEASQQRLLFQSELEREKNELEAAEVALKKAQESSGVVLPESQTQAGLSAIDAARADIRVKQVQLAALLEGQTDQSPQVMRARSEIQAEEAQLHRLESSAGGGPGSGLSAGQAPSLNLKFVQLEREVKYHQVLFDVMAKQYEEARLQESSAAPGVQVVDFPELPLRKSWPRRSLFALVGGVLGLLLALVIVFVKNRVRALRQNPERASSLQQLRHAWTGARFRP